MNNSDLIKAVNTILTSLISPKLNNLVNFEVSVDTSDFTGELFVYVDVNVNRNNYWEMFHSGYYNNGEVYNSAWDFDDKIIRDVKQVLKYLNIQNSVIEVYAIKS